MASKVNLMSQAEYARHRGCSKVAVGKAVKANRISLVNGKIDPAVADIQWQKNSRARAGTQTSAQLQLEASSTLDEPAKVDDYMFNRNRREAAEAERAELSLAEEKGQLIRVDAVKAAVAGVFSATRDALLQIPARLGPQLAAESDAAKAQSMLHAEIHQALQDLCGLKDRIGQPDVATP
jgi:hypothetical protein